MLGKTDHPPALESMGSALSNRVWYFDNVKALLIFLVVLGHVVEAGLKTGRPGAMVTYLFIYTFHMPLFIFLAGYFSKRALRPGEPFPKQRALGFFLLYALLEWINFGADQFLTRPITPGSRPPAMQFLTASGPPWYLLAMIWWMLFTFLLHTVRPGLKRWLVLALAVLAGVAIGYDQHQPDFLAFPRAVVMYPFFLAGLYCKPEWLEALRRRIWARGLAALILGATAVILYSQREEAFPLRGLLSGRNTYIKITPIPDGFGGVYRLACYALAALLCCCVLSAMPNIRVPVLTDVGKHTLQIYFWQSILIPILIQGGWLLEFFRETKMIWVAAATVAAVMLLAQKPFGWPLDYLMKPKIPASMRRKVDEDNI